MSDPLQHPDSERGPLSGPLGRRLLLGFVLFSLAPLVASNALGYTRSERIIEGLVERYLSGIAVLQARHVGERLDDLVRVLDELASHPSVAGIVDPVPSPSGDLETHLARALEDYPELEALYVFDEKGQVRFAAPLSAEDIVLWIGPPLERPVERVEVRRDSFTPHYPYLRLAVSVGAARDEASVMYLGATVRLMEPPSIFAIPEHTARSVETVVVDDLGRPVFVSHPHGHIDYSLRFETPLLEGAGAFALYADRQGTEVLGVAAPIPGRPWHLINEVPAADALVELQKLRSLSVWLATLIAFMGAGAAWLIAGHVVAPVRDLVFATRRLGQGDLSTRVASTTKDEIGELASSFNRMAADLEETSARVDELHRREMERAGQLATVGELAAGVAHEIKNPVAAISGGMELITKRIPDDEELGRIAVEMRKQTDRIGMAVRDLMRFARPIEPTLSPTDVNEVVERARLLTTAAAEGARVTIEPRLEPGLPTIEADGQLLGQCLVNLIINGIQAAGDGGRVMVTTSLEGDEVRIEIVDSGPGVPADEADKIFKPFYTTKHQGTGLGLPITAEIVARHKGRIDLTSEPVEGARFTVLLPVEGDEPTS